MSANRNQRGLLIEIMICVLFFALSATVLMEMFVASREYSRRAGDDARVLVNVQALAELLYAADDAEALLSEQGYIKEENHYCLTDGEHTMTVSLEEEKMEAGALRTALITALQGDRVVVQLPSVRYLPGEVAP